jgi:hypothetical protein
VARRHRRVGLGERRSFGLHYRRPEERLGGDGAAQRRVSERTGVARRLHPLLALRGVEHWSSAEENRDEEEGRISVVKRRHGLNRSRYKGDDGMKRWVGLGVIADNLLNIARAKLAEP